MELFKKALAECLGTMILVIVGCGVAVATGAEEVATSLAFGLAIVALAYTIGGVSGCHVNPAVSFGLFVAKKMSVKDLLVYWAAQLVGAVAGAGVLYLIFMNMTGKGGSFGANQVQTALLSEGNLTVGSLILGCVVELVLTFVFVFAVLGVTAKSENGAVAGIVIGLALCLVHLLGLPLTGTSVNPARSIGPALLALANGKTEPIKELWVFIVGPFAGAGLAGLAFTYFSHAVKTADSKAK